MSEYWKSNAKKYCDVCKTWISDNKSSIAIHEGGKTHKEKVAEKLKLIKKRNDQKSAEDKKYNSELAAIERAAMAAMSKDIEANPSLKRQYASTEKNPQQNVCILQEHTPEAKKHKKEKPKPAAVKVPEKVEKKTEPETPEQQSRIGKWQSIVQPKVVEPLEVINVDLQLPKSSGRTNKFEALSLDQLQYELRKADVEFRNKGNLSANMNAAKVEGKMNTKPQVVNAPARHQIKIPEQSKWKAVTESNGFREEAEERCSPKPEIKIEAAEPIGEYKEVESIQPPYVTEVKKESVTEKIVTLNSSSKKKKIVAFKKRKTDSTQQNLRERKSND